MKIGRDNTSFIILFLLNFFIIMHFFIPHLKILLLKMMKKSFILRLRKLLPIFMHNVNKKYVDPIKNLMCPTMNDLLYVTRPIE